MTPLGWKTATLPLGAVREDFVSAHRDTLLRLLAGASDAEFREAVADRLKSHSLTHNQGVLLCDVLDSLTKEEAMKKVVEINVNAGQPAVLETRQADSISEFADGLGGSPLDPRKDPRQPQPAELTMSADVAVGTLENRLAAALPSFDLGSILAIVDAITAVLGLCKSEGTKAKDVKRNARGPLARMRLRQALRAQGIAPLSRQGQEAMQAALAIADDAQEYEVVGIMKAV